VNPSDESQRIPKMLEDISAHDDVHGSGLNPEFFAFDIADEDLVEAFARQLRRVTT
jgi:hypothetical protein